MSHPAAPLESFQPTRGWFVGIDSDGCAFDTMEVKHKECFIPPVIAHYHLAAVSKYVREAAEFINLYSQWRGCNRFTGLILELDLVRQRPEVLRRGAAIPELKGLRDWVSRETKLGNPALRKAVDDTGDPDLVKALAWSQAVNRAVEEIVHDVPPFPLVRESLEKLQGRADVLVVSATPGEALVREWEEHDLAQYVALIAGQEMGTKKEHLTLAARGRYAPDHMIMVGDAPGDRAAAEAVGALFYPINPGDEDASWHRFHAEALNRFFAGTYAGAYMEGLIADFEARLPDRPPWS